VADGDRIEIDLEARRIDLDVTSAVLEQRRAAYVAPEATVTRGYLAHYARHVASANRGAVMPR
jgi:dihydroxy-acid dehydratase